MPKKQIKNNFNAGELSEYIAGRTDLQKYYNGCSRLVNGTPLTYGGIEKRPGTFFREIAKSECRVLSFQFSVDDTHILEMGANYMRVLKNGSYITIANTSVPNWNIAGSIDYEVNDFVQDTGAFTANYYYCNTAHTSSAGTDIDDAGDLANWTIFTASDATNLIYELYTPFSVSDIFGAHTVQSADVMYIASDGQHPQKISRFGDDDWTIIDVDFSGGPFLDQNTDSDYTLTFTHDEVAFDSPHYHLVGAQGTLTATEATFATGHVGSIWQLESTRTDDISVEQIIVGTSAGIPIKGTFSVDATGFSAESSARLTLERKEGDGDWAAYRTFTAAIAFTSEENSDDVFYRLVLTNAVLLSAVLTAREQVQLGAVHIDSFTNNQLVNVTVTNDVYHSHEAAVALASMQYGTGQDVEVISATHGYSTGDRVFFDSIVNVNFSYLNNDGTQDATYQITVIDSTTFTLDGTSATGGTPGLTALTGDVQKLSATTTTSQWAEGSWSSLRGFPTATTFHEDRLWFASTSNNPQTLWGSVTGDYENFEADVFDDSALVFALNVNDISEIQWLTSRNSLLIGTANSEHSLSAANPENAITPSDVKVRNLSVYGSSGIQPHILNNALFYAQRANRKMRGLIFNLETLSSRSFDTNRLHNTILEGGVVDMAVQKSLEGVVYIVRTDGTMAAFTYEPEEEVAGWSRMVTGRLGQSGFIPSDGKFTSVAVTSGSTQDVVTAVVNRQIDSSSVYYIEELAPSQIRTIDDAVFLDSCIQVTDNSEEKAVVMASDTILCDEGLCNSSLCGGVV